MKERNKEINKEIDRKQYPVGGGVKILESEAKRQKLGLDFQAGSLRRSGLSRITAR